jgi:hypothetical protein
MLAYTYFKHYARWAAVLVLIGCSQRTSRAGQVIVTVHGTITSGDDNGIFVPGSVFTDLKGKNFTLTLTFDDKVAPPAIINDGNGGAPNKSDYSGTGSMSPGSAVISIDDYGSPYAFPSSTQSEAVRFATGKPGSAQPGYESFSVYADHGINTGADDFVRVVYQSAALDTASINNGPILDYNWESYFTDQNVTCCDTNFSISEKIPDSWNTAGAYLHPTSITVSGPLNCASGSLAPPPSPTGTPHSYSYMDWMCSENFISACSPDIVFSLLIHFATPPPSQSVNTCDQTTVSGLGSVVHYVDPDDLSITNVTLPDHKCYPGMVTRSVVNMNGNIYIQTVGTGTGGDVCSDPFWTGAGWRAVDYGLIYPLIHAGPLPF